MSEEIILTHKKNCKHSIVYENKEGAVVGSIYVNNDAFKDPKNPPVKIKIDLDTCE